MLQLPPFRYQTNNAAVYAGAALASVAITSATSFNTAENTTAVATLTATGGGTITWSKTGGADTAKFSIGSSSGVLAFVSPPDFETPTDADANNIYVVQVQATNGTTIDTKTINVTVTDVAETVLDLDFTATPTLDPRITFSRTSLATYYAVDGLLKYAGHNLVPQSQTFNSSWSLLSGATITADATTAPDGTTTADRLNHVTAGTVVGGYVNQTTSAPLDKFIFSCYAKAGSKNWVALGGGTGGGLANFCFFDLLNGVVGAKGSAYVSSAIQNIGSGWYRCSIIGTAGSAGGNNPSIRVAEINNSLNCTSPGDIYLWGAQTENVLTATTPSTYIPTTTVAVYGPRFDFDPVTHAAKGLLMEEARTNVIWPNRDLTHSRWVKTSCTAALNQTGIDGGANTASSLTATAANATCLQTITLASSVRYQSAYVKRLTGSGVVNMTMDGGATWTPVSVTSSWTRVEIPSATVTNPSVGFRLVVSGDVIAVDCVQNENGAFATSAMITPSATFARAADVATMSGTNFSTWYNQTAGTFVAEFDLFAASGTRGILAADNNTTAETIQLYGSGTDPKVTIIDNSATQADLDVGTIAANTTYKLGAAYALNDIAACINGGTVGTDTAATLPTPTQLRIGTESATAANILNGHVRRVQFWNVRQSNSAMQALTT